MRRVAAIVLFAAGAAMIAMNAWQWWDSREQQKQSARQAESLLAEAQKMEITRKDFQPGKNETIGVLHIPSIDADLPIVEGTDPEDLKKGVGHYATTAFPGDRNQIVLSGHRDTVFRRFGELEQGDEFVVELPYGTFRYRMEQTKIVAADDTTIIGPTDQREELVLTTCYPFGYVGSAPDRYIIYAYPVEA